MSGYIASLPLREIVFAHRVKPRIAGSQKEDTHAYYFV